MSLQLLNAEIEKLDHLASFAENELENGENLPEEASGKLRAAAGKARLLIRQKLHQFEGLCHKNMVSVRFRKGSQQLSQQLTVSFIYFLTDLFRTGEHLKLC